MATSPLQKIVYGNMEAFVAARGLQGVVWPSKPMDDFKSVGYVTIAAADHVIVLFRPGSMMAQSLPLFKKVIDGVGAAVPNIIVITAGGLSSSISNAMPALLAARPAITGFETYDYTRFIVPVDTHVHQIVDMPPDLRTLYVDPDMLPMMSRSDTVAVWLGAKKGAIIRSLRQSDSVGQTVSYRVVT